MVVRRSKEVYDHMNNRRVEPDTQTYQDYMRVSREFHLRKRVLYLFRFAAGAGPRFHNNIDGRDLYAVYYPDTVRVSQLTLPRDPYRTFHLQGLIGER